MEVKGVSSKAATVRRTCTASYLMMLLEAGILTQQVLEHYCYWLIARALEADSELNPEAGRTDFDYFEGYARELETLVRKGSIKRSQALLNYSICLCMAASDGVNDFLKRKVTDAKCEMLFKKYSKAPTGIEVYPDFDEGEFERNCYKELNAKLRELAAHL